MYTISGQPLVCRMVMHPNTKKYSYLTCFSSVKVTSVIHNSIYNSRHILLRKPELYFYTLNVHV